MKGKSPAAAYRVIRHNMSIEIKSAKSEKSLRIDLVLNQWWDDDELQLVVGVEAEAKLEVGKFSIDFLAGYSLSEIASSIEKLSKFEISREGALVISLSGCDHSYNDITLNITFSAIDSLGHIGAKVKYSKAERYSNNKDFIFTIEDEFEVYPDVIDSVLCQLQRIISSDKQNA
ncbi:MAG: hypothetical protein GY749_31280 [Desulfobacteraceae bacterium]|nr:hypothetical protein [Desulfobacteraceae bacterium]